MCSRSKWTDVFTSDRKASIWSRSLLHLGEPLLERGRCRLVLSFILSPSQVERLPQGACQHPRIQIGFSCNHRAASLASRTAYRKHKGIFVALDRVNPFAWAVGNFLPAAEKLPWLCFYSWEIGYRLALACGSKHSGLRKGGIGRNCSTYPRHKSF